KYILSCSVVVRRSLMASKPMFTLIEATLQTCRIEGTSVRESGLTVSTETQPGEMILFFHIDQDEGRKYLKMVGESLKICDYLVFYTKDDEDRELVCLLELKGRKLEDAVKQVLNTHRHIRALSNEKIPLKQHQHIAWKICICLHGQAPRSSQ